MEWIEKVIGLKILKGENVYEIVGFNEDEELYELEKVIGLKVIKGENIYEIVDFNEEELYEVESISDKEKKNNKAEETELFIKSEFIRDKKFKSLILEIIDMIESTYPDRNYTFEDYEDEELKEAKKKQENK